MPDRHGIKTNGLDPNFLSCQILFAGRFAMEVDYTGRQIEITPAIKKFTEKHLKKIRKILGESY